MEEPNSTNSNEDYEELYSQMNANFHKTYGYLTTIFIRPSAEDYDMLLNYISSAPPGFKEMGQMWLDKFNVFIDSQPNTERPTLRQRSDALSTQFFINGEALSTAPMARPVPINRGSASASTTVSDLSFLPGDMPEIPQLRNDDKFNLVKVSYNELDQFFKIADKKTKFENLYDLLCAQACNTMFTQNRR